MSDDFAPDRYQRLPYRRCGRSGVMLPAISLGCWHNFGDAETPENRRALLRRAFDLGITHYDQENNYGPPPASAETNVGRILKEDFGAHRDELIISSKAGFRMWAGPYGEWGSRKNLLASLDQSLKRLQLDYVDIFYSHRPDPNTPLAETMGALEQAVRSGKALYAGISSYNSVMTRRAATIMKGLGTPLLIHQPSYNLLNRWVENENLFFHTAQHGLGVIAFCPLAQGLLTSRYLNGIPPDSRAGKPAGFLRPQHVTPEVVAKVKALNELAAGRGQTLAQMALTWVLRRPEVTSALIGASKVSQLDENVAAATATPLSAAELARIDAIVKGQA